MKFGRSDDFYIRRLLKETKLKAIMRTPVISVKQDEAFSTVADKFHDHNIRHLPVVDEINKLVGLITQRDFFRIHSPRRLMDGGEFYDKASLNQFILKNVMTKDPFTLTPEQSVADAVTAMAEFKYGCIPIVDKYRELQGIVTNTDILQIAADILGRSKAS